MSVLRELVPFYAWSYLLMAVGLTGLWVAGSRRSCGWLIGVLAQVLWIVYALATEQYGFLISALAYAFVYARNYVSWRRTADHA